MTSDTSDSDIENLLVTNIPAMDPINTVDYARLRTETSNILKRLKRQCESDLEDLDLSHEAQVLDLSVLRISPRLADFLSFLCEFPTSAQTNPQRP